MTGWQIAGNGKLNKINKIEQLSGIDSVKVKILKTLITEDDIAFMLNKKSPNIIPGRMAIGQITEMPYESEYLKKGTKVAISAVKSCGKCNNCLRGDSSNCSDLIVAGHNADGFLKDFAVFSSADVHTFPQNVSEEEVIYLEYVSLALKVIDKLKIEKGQHVGIIGGSVLGSTLAQLIIYYQGVPIIIDDDEENLLLAKKSGIYYTVKTGAKAEKEISSVTGGRMLEKMVFVTGSQTPPELAFNLLAPFGKAAFAGFSPVNLKASLNVALEKQLSVSFITSGFGNAETAINILANKAIDFSNYSVPLTKMEDIEKNIDAMCKKYAKKEKVQNLLVNMLG